MTAHPNRRKDDVELQMEGEHRFTRLEQQVDRLVADAESEKETRRRVSTDETERFNCLDKRIRVLERNMYIAFGAVAMLQLVLKLT